MIAITEHRAAFLRTLAAYEGGRICRDIATLETLGERSGAGPYTGATMGLDGFW